MADLNLVNGYLPEGQREFRGSNSTMDELQLAALLGKTLLEKNSDLDLKLRRLQEFAEETLVLNQSLTRQLSESRDSLQFSNKTCEQLEAKIDELERTNGHLQRQTLSQQSSLEHKSEKICVLEEELSEMKLQNEGLREQITHLLSDKNQSRLTTAMEETRTRERSKSCHSSPEVSKEMDSLVSELTGRVQKLTFQKEKAERQLAKMLVENESLLRNIERAEGEVDELTTRVATYEEIIEKQGLQSTPLSTPKQPRSTSTPTFTLPPLTEDHPPQPHCAHSGEEKSQDSGLSLFNELDSEISSLRRHYDTLVQGCTCSASIHHKSWSGDSSQTEEGAGRGDKQIQERPFKELFEEMFATLKQTAQVADRLIERKTGTSTEREE